MIRIIWISFVTLMLASCATVAPNTTPVSVPWKNRTTLLQQLQTWGVNGKIAVQTAQDSGSATIDWKQNQQQYQLMLSGPLGATGMTLNGQPNQVTLTMANGKTYHAQSAEQLLAQQWGFNLPVSSLKYWIRGVPVPSVPYTSQSDQYQRLTELNQQGWHIQYMSYTNLGKIDLPQRILVTSPTLKAKMIIYSWEIK